MPVSVTIETRVTDALQHSLTAPIFTLCFKYHSQLLGNIAKIFTLAVEECVCLCMLVGIIELTSCTVSDVSVMCKQKGEWSLTKGRHYTHCSKA